jgi:hypothetical protein
MTHHAEKIRLEGKDWFTEDEAAVYCGVALSTFREGYRALGIVPKRVFGRKLYSRSDLYQAIASSPEWQPSTRAATPGISHGQRAVSTSADPSARLRGQRLREYVPRRKQN